MKNTVELNLTKTLPIPNDIVIGKDILELVSGAMYVDPLDLYREYIQNSTDAIDLCEDPTCCNIHIQLEPTCRQITIKDNGSGISNSEFIATMTAIGGSRKRSIPGSRGFRGVGRLAGLGYCRKLSFRSKASNDKKIYEITWDCVKFKKILRDASFTGDLKDVIQEVSEVSSYPALNDDSFFEVHLDGIVRLNNDVLLNAQAVKNHIAQVAPVPFHPEFSYSEELRAWLSKWEIGSSYDITLSDTDYDGNRPTPIYRPYRDEFIGASSNEDKISSINYFELPGVDGNTAAIGWIADTNYFGAIPPSGLISGIRIRVGNIQIGSSNLLANEFPEPRFNSWSIGEIHVISKCLTPNGRRDNFEENVHFDNLISQLHPHLKDIASVCRKKSSQRQWKQRFYSKVASVDQDISLVESGSVSESKLGEKLSNIETAIIELEELISSSKYDWTKDLSSEIIPLKKRVSKIAKRKEKKKSDPLSFVPYQKRLAYQEILELVYEVSANKEAGNLMINKLIKRIEAKHSSAKAHQ